MNTVERINKMRVDKDCDAVVRMLRTGRYTIKAVARDTGLHHETVRAARAGASRPQRSTVAKIKAWLQQFGGWRE